MSLDGLRAVAVLLVMAGHVGVSRFLPGGFGVTIFFFLSGYLITTLLVREWMHQNTVSLRHFYLRRALRLGPPLVLTLLLALWLASLHLIPGDLDLGALLSQLFFVYNYAVLHLSTASSADAMGVLWSLSVEEQFYLIWPLVFLALARGWVTLNHLVALLVVILIWRCWRFYGLGHSEWMIYISTDARLDSLLYGCVLALVMMQGRVPAVAQRTDVIYAALIGAFAVLCLTFILRDPGFRSTLRYSLQGLALMPIFYYAITRPDLLVFRPLNTPLLRRIGVYSYSAYLVHFVIMHLLEGQGMGRGDSLGYMVLVMALSFGWAALIYEIAERPLKPLRVRLSGHAPAFTSRRVSSPSR